MSDCEYNYEEGNPVKIYVISDCNGSKRGKRGHRGPRGYQGNIGPSLPPGLIFTTSGYYIVPPNICKIMVTAIGGGGGAGSTGIAGGSSVSGNGGAGGVQVR